MRGACLRRAAKTCQHASPATGTAYHHPFRQAETADLLSSVDSGLLHTPIPWYRINSLHNIHRLIIYINAIHYIGTLLQCQGCVVTRGQAVRQPGRKGVCRAGGGEAAWPLFVISLAASRRIITLKRQRTF